MEVIRRQAMVGVGGWLAILAAPDSFADDIKTEGDRWATIVMKSGAEAG